MPKHNKGVSFINDLFENMKDPHNKMQILAHQCLMKNLKQLDNLLNLQDLEFYEKVSNITGKFTQYMNKKQYENLKILNKDFELLIKKRLNEIKDDNGINETQAFYLIVVQGYLFIVSFVICCFICYLV